MVMGRSVLPQRGGEAEGACGRGIWGSGALNFSKGMVNKGMCRRGALAGVGAVWMGAVFDFSPQSPSRGHGGFDESRLLSRSFFNY